jgi:hypothetical protein
MSHLFFFLTQIHPYLDYAILQRRPFFQLSQPKNYQTTPILIQLAHQLN